MSPEELKQMIDARTIEERKWMTAYLIDEMFAVPELRQTAAELSARAQRRSELLARLQRVTQAEAEHLGKIAEEPSEQA